MIGIWFKAIKPKKVMTIFHLKKTFLFFFQIQSAFLHSSEQRILDPIPSISNRVPRLGRSLHAPLGVLTIRNLRAQSKGGRLREWNSRRHHRVALSAAPPFHCRRICPAPSCVCCNPVPVAPSWLLSRRRCKEKSDSLISHIVARPGYPGAPRCVIARFNHTTSAHPSLAGYRTRGGYNTRLHSARRTRREIRHAWYKTVSTIGRRRGIGNNRPSSSPRRTWR